MNIQRADKNKAVEVSILVGELLTEIMQKINSQAFHFNFEATVQRLQDFIEHEKSFIFIAAEEKNIIGFITMYESFALYAEGAFGTIAEFYVKPSFRSKGIGKALIQKAKEFGYTKGWTRLEVTTPPLPQFDIALAFYERESFEITGGRKLKVLL